MYEMRGFLQLLWLKEENLFGLTKSKLSGSLRLSTPTWWKIMLQGYLTISLASNLVGSLFHFFCPFFPLVAFFYFLFQKFSKVKCTEWSLTTLPNIWIYQQAWGEFDYFSLVACKSCQRFCVRTGLHKPQNGPRTSRCTSSQSQTQMVIFFHTASAVLGYICLHRAAACISVANTVVCFFFFWVRQVGGNLCVQLVAIFNSSSLPECRKSGVILHNLTLPLCCFLSNKKGAKIVRK